VIHFQRTRALAASALLASALIASACATGTDRPVAVESRNASGFTIKENQRLGLGARSDFDRAVRLLRDEKLEAGIALLEEVTREAPYLTAAHIDLGIAYREVGDLERARKSLERALEIRPRHPVVHNELGIVHRKSGRFAEARASYEAALDRYPDFHFARLNVAILCDLFLEDLECALEHYEKYAEEVPGDEKATMWIADLRNRIGR
jgi:tetratricopeptide (TPR) repeat protein